jgi:hypothetical protein
VVDPKETARGPLYAPPELSKPTQAAAHSPIQRAALEELAWPGFLDRVAPFYRWGWHGRRCWRLRWRRHDHVAVGRGVQLHVEALLLADLDELTPPDGQLGMTSYYYGVGAERSKADAIVDGAKLEAAACSLSCMPLKTAHETKLPRSLTLGPRAKEGGHERRAHLRPNLGRGYVAANSSSFCIRPLGWIFLGRDHFQTHSDVPLKIPKDS